jgi:anhydro-N-acetylmuramic acid kinase
MRRTDELGVPEAAKEALVFAIIGFLTLNGLPATVPSCTGAARPSVLGSLTPGRAPLADLLAPGLLAPAVGGGGQVPRAPTRLVVGPPLSSA